MHSYIFFPTPPNLSSHFFGKRKAILRHSFPNVYCALTCLLLKPTSHICRYQVFYFTPKGSYWVVKKVVIHESGHITALLSTFDLWLLLIYSHPSQQGIRHREVPEPLLVKHLLDSLIPRLTVSIILKSTIALHRHSLRK